MLGVLATQKGSDLVFMDEIRFVPWTCWYQDLNISSNGCALFFVAMYIMII